MPRQEAERLVIAQLGKDPEKRHGARTIKRKIAFNEGVHLTRYTSLCCICMLSYVLIVRDFVSMVMHAHDPEGFKRREPPKVSTGTRWHDEDKADEGGMIEGTMEMTLTTR
jgi:hypothetical protein